jgi:hypothetical protein
VPSGATAIWLPWKYVFERRIATGRDQLAPALVVREIIGSPRNANEWKSAFSTLRCSAGCVKRIQVAYA